MFDSVIVELESAVTNTYLHKGFDSDQRDEVIAKLERALDLAREASSLAQRQESL